MSRPPKLDARLQAAADSLPEGCSLAADIGADHGRLSCYCLRQGLCQEMLVSDISEAALAKARRLLSRHGLEARARFVVADGFEALDGAVEAVVVCGMGGKTIAGMLNRAELLRGARLVLSANTQLPLLREKLMQVEYRILSEQVVQAAGRYYSIMVAQPGQMRLSERERSIGRGLRGSSSASLLDYFNWRVKVASAAIGSDSRQQELKWLREEIQREEANQSACL